MDNIMQKMSSAILAYLKSSKPLTSLSLNSNCHMGTGVFKLSTPSCEFDRIFLILHFQKTAFHPYLTFSDMYFGLFERKSPTKIAGCNNIIQALPFSKGKPAELLTPDHNRGEIFRKNLPQGGDFSLQLGLFDGKIVSIELKCYIAPLPKVRYTGTYL